MAHHVTSLILQFNRVELVTAMTYIILLLVSGFLGISFAATCQDSPFRSYKYCNASLSITERVEDLVSRMTTAEKISQLVTGAPAIDNLAIPAYQWWSEGLHGVAGSPGVHFGGDVPVATSFPQVIGLGATFNTSLIRKMAGIISTEARAFSNNGRAGLSYFAPNINIFRDPRWGRGQETPGEDPYLTGQYVTQFVKGMQEGEDSRYLKVVATCKHFCAYDIENANGTSRHAFNAIVSDQDLVETYFPAFRACVLAGGASIMCSYNAVNGVPSCANDLINNQITRKEWGFEGYIVSDCGAVNDIMNSHHYTKTVEDTVKAGLRGGCDLDCGRFYSTNGQKAYDAKAINDDDLNLAMTRLFTYRMRLGMFDPPSAQPYVTEFPPSVVNTPDHQDAALEAARQGIVLLKNDGTLPLQNGKQNVAVIGPHGNATSTMQGNYKGTAPYLISPLMGLQKVATSSKITYSQGCDVKCTDTSKFSDAVNVAKGADIVIMVIGLDEGQESEGHDRSSIGLPGNQGQLVQQVKQQISNKPLIVVLMSGGGVDIANESSMANAVLWTGYPGQSGGMALAEILYGVVNPSGRLPITMYPADYVNEVEYANMSMRAGPGRTYKFYTGKPVFEFGMGLSYTTFAMDWSNTALLRSSVSLEELQDDTINYEVKVTNSGKMGGATSVLAFVSSNISGSPIKELFGFQKVYLDPGKSEMLVFSVGPQVFQTVDIKGISAVKKGEFVVTIGSLSHKITVQ